MMARMSSEAISAAPAETCSPLSTAGRRWAWISLLAIALLAGIGWRVELECRSGWYSLLWLNYFHWAIPAGVLAFIGWTLGVARVRRTWLFLAVLLAFAAAGYWVVNLAAHFYFGAGPAGMISVFQLGGGDLDRGFARMMTLHRWMPALWALIPLSFCVLCREFGLRIPAWMMVVSAAMFVISWPLAIRVRGLFETQGFPDLLDALKSGFVIPFLIYALGWPVVMARSPRKG